MTPVNFYLTTCHKKTLILASMVGTTPIVWGTPTAFTKLPFLPTVHSELDMEQLEISSVEGPIASCSWRWGVGQLRHQLLAPNGDVMFLRIK